jgi:hypothetical protein
MIPGSPVIDLTAVPASSLSPDPGLARIEHLPVFSGCREIQETVRVIAVMLLSPPGIKCPLVSRALTPPGLIGTLSMFVPDGRLNTAALNPYGRPGSGRVRTLSRFASVTAVTSGAVKKK